MSDAEIRALCLSAYVDCDADGVDWHLLREAFDHVDNGSLYIQDWRNIFDVYVPVWNRKTDCIRLEDDPPFRDHPGTKLPDGIRRSNSGGPLEYPWAIVARRCGCPPFDARHFERAKGDRGFNWPWLLVLVGSVLLLGVFVAFLQS